MAREPGAPYLLSMPFDAPASLPQIPTIELGDAGPLALLEAEAARAERLLSISAKVYPRPLVRLGDRLSRQWLLRSGNPHLGEIDAIAARLGQPGAYFLNVNYEWACTSGVGPEVAGEESASARLYRVLDWAFQGLGAEIVAARAEGPAGPWINLTWPGFTGSIQGMAPGRFAACFNQAPLRHHSGLMPLDWAVERGRVWRTAGLPPAHLLRRAFETCPDYAAARTLLAETPLALPALFVLSGLAPTEGCVIERQERAVTIHDGPDAIANAWLTRDWRGRPRGRENAARRDLMRQALDESAFAAAEIGGTETGAPAGAFAWLRPPVLNPTSRLAMEANATTGRLAAVGIENEEPATQILRLAA